MERQTSERSIGEGRRDYGRKRQQKYRQPSPFGNIPLETQMVTTSSYSPHYYYCYYYHNYCPRNPAPIFRWRCPQWRRLSPIFVRGKSRGQGGHDHIYEHYSVPPAVVYFHLTPKLTKSGQGLVPTESVCHGGGDDSGAISEINLDLVTTSIVSRQRY